MAYLNLLSTNHFLIHSTELLSNSTLKCTHWEEIKQGTVWSLLGGQRENKRIKISLTQWWAASVKFSNTGSGVQLHCWELKWQCPTWVSTVQPLQASCLPIFLHSNPKQSNNKSAVGERVKNCVIHYSVMWIMASLALASEAWALRSNFKNTQCQWAYIKFFSG